MITAVEREDAFKRDLKKLLLEHGAMLDMCTSDPYSTLEVTMCAVVDENIMDTKREHTSFILDTSCL